jgi:hypothetical protein
MFAAKLVFLKVGFKRRTNSQKSRCDDKTPRAAKVGTHIIMMKVRLNTNQVCSREFSHVFLFDTENDSNLVNRPHY